MAGVLMASMSDYIYGDSNHNQFHTSAAINASCGIMPATSLAFNERARNYTQGIDVRTNTFNNYEMGSTINNNVEAAQELADVLRGILDDQLAELSNHNSNNEASYYFNSLKPTSSLTNQQYNHPVDVSAHHADSKQLLVDVLDSQILQHAEPISNIISSNTLLDAGNLLVLTNPFNLDSIANQSLSSTSAIDSDTYSKMTSNSCSSNHMKSYKSSSIQEYDDHHILQPIIDLDSSCTNGVSPAHSFDDYSLCSINGGASAAVLAGNELLPRKGMPAGLAVLNAGECFDINDGNNCGDQHKNCSDQHNMVVEMVANHGNMVSDYAKIDSDDNVCIEDHMVPEHVEIDGDDNVCIEDHMVSEHIKIHGDDKCVRDAARIACSQGYGMVCENEGLYGGGEMKVMQREAVYAAAAMRPVDWTGILAGSVGTRPKRRNVRISHDPQTASARRRRERISDRIRVLQRMVPGGTKMDTASMLDEAIQYLKYLKSQVQALEWLDQRRSSPSPSNCLSLLSSSSPSPCLYPTFNTTYIQPSPNSSRLMIIN